MRMLIRRSAIETVFVEVYGMIIVMFGNVYLRNFVRGDEIRGNFPLIFPNLPYFVFKIFRPKISDKALI